MSEGRGGRGNGRRGWSGEIGQGGVKALCFKSRHGELPIIRSRISSETKARLEVQVHGASIVLGLFDEVNCCVCPASTGILIYSLIILFHGTGQVVVVQRQPANASNSQSTKRFHPNIFPSFLFK